MGITDPEHDLRAAQLGELAALAVVEGGAEFFKGHGGVGSTGTG